VKFSERKGHKPVSRVIQKDGMSVDLRNSLWNVLDLVVWNRQGFIFRQYGKGDIEAFSQALWFQFFKLPVDSRPDHEDRILAEIREFFFSCKWYEVYDFLEWALTRLNKGHLVDAVNNTLERELAGYRFVGGVFTDITGAEEVELIETALVDHEFPGVRSHLQTALQHLSNRESPDYRNSIKESISAVESIAQVISGKPKATLADALSELEKKGHLHPALKKGFASLYGYASDEGGIRHAMMEEPNLGPDDAKFFLLSCTSFINYLKTRL